MLNGGALPAIDDFDALRAREFARLDEADTAYLDFTGAALYSASQADAYARRLTSNIYGNPHSAHAPSRFSERELDAARAATLAFFDADPDVYDVCFTQNASAAIKLVAESYRFGSKRGLALTADNHNSVNGIREFARSAGAPISVLPLDPELRLATPEHHLAAIAKHDGAGLFAFPAQSNFSGVKHPLSLVQEAHAQGFDVLIDAAAAGVTGDISLRAHPADFVALSFYKLFGLPTGVGALIAKRDALERLRRPWFAGGTVDFVSIAHDRHQLLRGHGGFEDGTPNFLNAGAITSGFDFVFGLDIEVLRARLDRLTALFIERAQSLRHRNGAPLVKLYGPQSMTDRGGAVAFNVLEDDGRPIPYQRIETLAAHNRVAVRGGCFCNPGASEHAFGLGDDRVAASLDQLGANFSVAGLQQTLGAETAVGALRLSVGLPTNQADIERAIAMLETVKSGSGAFEPIDAETNGRESRLLRSD